MARKSKLKTTERRAVYVGTGDSLASIIEQVAKLGITDFSRVCFDADSQSCCSDHGDGYSP